MIDRIRKYRAYLLGAACLILSLLIFIGQRPDQPLRMLSCSEQYYLAQQVAAGGDLYREFAWNKTPLSIYISSWCFGLSKGDLAPAVVWVRFIYWAIFLAGAWPLWGLGRILFAKDWLAALGVMLYICFPFVLHHLAGEPDWHVPMISLGLYAVYFNARARYFLAGLCAGLAFMSWQPGAVYLILIVACIVLEEGNRAKFLGRAFIGFALPVFLFAVYFLSRGTFGDFFKMAFVSVRQNITQGFLDELRDIPRYASYCYSVYQPVSILSMVGLFMHLISLLRTKAEIVSRKAEKGVGLAAVLTVGYSMVDFQHCDDFLAFMPWIALYAVYPLKELLRIRHKLSARLTGGIVFILLFVSAARSFGHPWPVVQNFFRHSPYAKLRKQQSDFLNVLEGYGYKQDSQIVCLESALPCLLTGKMNTDNKYVYLLDDYYLAYIQQHELEAREVFFEAIKRREADFVFLMHDTLERRGYHETTQQLESILSAGYRQNRTGRLEFWIPQKNRSRY